MFLYFVIQGVPDHPYQVFFSVGLGSTKWGTARLNRELTPRNPNFIVPKLPMSPLGGKEGVTIPKVGVPDRLAILLH